MQKKLWGRLVMERKPRISFETYVIKNILYRNIYNYLNKHIFKWHIEKGMMLTACRRIDKIPQPLAELVVFLKSFLFVIFKLIFLLFCGEKIVHCNIVNNKLLIVVLQKSRTRLLWEFFSFFFCPQYFPQFILCFCCGFISAVIEVSADIAGEHVILLVSCKMCRAFSQQN